MRYVLSTGTDKFIQYAAKVFGIVPIGKIDMKIVLEGINKIRLF